jgi:hypothetical protein
LVDAIEVAEERAKAVVVDIETRLRATGLINDDLDVVLLVGNRTSNAWVSDLHGVPALFLAMELFPGPPYDAVAVAHEAVHVTHVRRGGGGWPEDVGGVLFQEGLATAASRVLHTGLSDAEYCWVDSEHEDWIAESDSLLSDVIDNMVLHLEEPCEALLGTALFAGDAKHENGPAESATASGICWSEAVSTPTNSKTSSTGHTLSHSPSYAAAYLRCSRPNGGRR